MYKYRILFFNFLVTVLIFALVAPQVQALSFSNTNLFNFTKYLKPKPSKTPKPSPSPKISPSPSGSVLKGAGFEISPAAVDLTLNINETKKAFTLKSITAEGFGVYGYPAEYGSGLNWTVSSGGISPGSSTEVGIQVNSDADPGVYTSTGKVVNDATGEELTFPVKVTVIRPPDYPYVIFKYPNGGEEFTFGDTVKVTWDKHKIRDCLLGLTNGQGWGEWINTGLTGSESSYDWTINNWNMGFDPVQIKLELDCGSDQGRIDDATDGFITIKPSATPTPTPEPISSPIIVPPSSPQYPGGSYGTVSVGVTIQSFFKPR